MAWKTALQTCTQLPEDIAILSLKLTFGVAPCPIKWCSMAEPATNLANAILCHPDWDPRELFSTLSDMLPERKDLPTDIPFSVGKKLVFDLPVDRHGMSECYIDDTFTQAADLPDSDNSLRAERALLLAVQTLARPLSDKEPMPRETMAACKATCGSRYGGDKDNVRMAIELQMHDNKLTGK